MGSKSNADNHSNQMNPNNDAYTSSRSGNHDWEDDNDFSKNIIKRNFGAGTSEKTYVPNQVYFFIAVAFDGANIHAKFNVPGEKGIVRAKPSSDSIVDSMIQALKNTLLNHCPLGIAYWRLAWPGNRGSFYWYSSGLGPQHLERRIENLNQDETAIARAKLWISTSRELAIKYELLVDWENHEGADDFGEITEEVIL
jgi:hypothetical protein